MADIKVPSSLSCPQTTTACAYCQESTNADKRIIADRRIYCGNLCAALGLIQRANEQDGIDSPTGIDAIQQLVAQSLTDGPVSTPKRVRDRDAEAALEYWPDSWWGKFVMVLIDDGGTPDWIPEPILTVPQMEIDRIVGDLLREGGERGGRP